MSYEDHGNIHSEGLFSLGGGGDELVCGSKPDIRVLDGPAGVSPGEEGAVGAMGLAFAVGLEARDSEFYKLGRVGNLI